MAPEPLSDGEQLVEDYLTSRGFTPEHHRQIGDCNPDFYIEHDPLGPVVFEVYEPTLVLPNKAGAFDSIPILQKAFAGRKRKQINAVKDAGLPYVGVVASTRMAIPVDALMMSGAMFGRISVQIRVPAAMDAEVDPGKFVFGSDARLQPTQFRGVSAVAIVRAFNPTQPVYDRAAHDVADQLGRDATAGDYLKALMPVQEELVASGMFNPDATAVRLIILHNHFADHPLDVAFGGPHDTQWRLYEQDGAGVYGEYLEGHMGREVPRRRDPQE